MSEKEVATTTPAEEVNQPEETVTPEQEPAAPIEQPAEAPKEETIGELFNEKTQPESIPKARLDKEIAKRKEAEKALADLQRKATEEDMSKGEIATDLKALADEHGIDPSFLNKLAGAIKAQAEAGFEERLRPITEKEQRAKRDAAFNAGFTKAMDNMPEYEGIVNPAVIKTLSLDPSNANKTFRQLIEEAYGNVSKGKKTLETALPRGGNASGELDYQRAKSDPAYFKEVMADPVLKKKYNDQMITEAS